MGTDAVLVLPPRRARLPPGSYAGADTAVEMDTDDDYEEEPSGPGKAVQVDPIKPMLKPPGCERLKLKCIDLLSIAAFNINVHRYTLAPSPLAPPPRQPQHPTPTPAPTLPPTLPQKLPPNAARVRYWGGREDPRPEVMDTVPVLVKHGE